MSSITPTIPIERPVIRPRPVTVSVPIADVTSAAGLAVCRGLSAPCAHPWAVPPPPPPPPRELAVSGDFFWGSRSRWRLCASPVSRRRITSSHSSVARRASPDASPAWARFYVVDAVDGRAGLAHFCRQSQRLHRCPGDGECRVGAVDGYHGRRGDLMGATAVTPGVPQEMILAFLAIAVVALGVFPLLIGAALLLRRDAAAHRRLIVIATTVFLSAAVHQLLMWAVDPAVTPPVFFAATDLFLVAVVCV